MIWDSLARIIDVSRWQGRFDWDDPDLGPVEGCIVKLVDGVGPAKRAAEHLIGVRGTTMLPGVYGLWQWEDDPREQAAALVAALPEWYGSGCLPPALDIETKEIKAALAYGVTPCEIVSDWLEWADEIERRMRVKGMVYISPRGIRKVRKADRLHELVRAFFLWLCDYGTVVDGLPAPGVTVGPTAPWDDWTILQYTSSLDGRKHGAKSRRLDGDLFNGTARELARWAQSMWGR